LASHPLRRPREPSTCRWAADDLAFSAPSLVVDVRRDPGQANLALSTVAPSVLVDYRRNPGQANLALSTTAPTVTWTDHHFIDPPSRDLSLSTVAPSISLPINNRAFSFLLSQCTLRLIAAMQIVEFGGK
jgi:hypothetical protein